MEYCDDSMVQIVLEDWRDIPVNNLKVVIILISEAEVYINLDPDQKLLLFSRGWKVYCSFGSNSGQCKN